MAAAAAAVAAAAATPAGWATLRRTGGLARSCELLQPTSSWPLTKEGEAGSLAWLVWRFRHTTCARRRCGTRAPCCCCPSCVKRQSERAMIWSGHFDSKWEMNSMVIRPCGHSPLRSASGSWSARVTLVRLTSWATPLNEPFHSQTSTLTPSPPVPSALAGRECQMLQTGAPASSSCRRRYRCTPRRAAAAVLGGLSAGSGGLQGSRHSGRGARQVIGTKLGLVWWVQFNRGRCRGQC